jgi:RNA polymerase sigma factor (sigma-70 family)
MKPGDAWAEVRVWFDAHGNTVLFTLACFGVPAASRPDLCQEVFATAYAALLRDEPIERPRAWLRGVARGYASNHRRRSEHAMQVLVDPDELVGTVDPGPSPYKLAEDRDRLQRILERIDPDAQELLIDIRVDGMSLDAIARERGITVHQARYLYQKAVKQAEDAVKSVDSDERSSIMLPLAFARLIDSVRADAEMSPDTQRRIWASLERRIHAEQPGGDGPPDTGHAAAGSPPAPSLSIRPANPAASWHAPALIALGSGLLIGGVCGWFLHAPKSAEPAPLESRQPVPALSRAESSAPQPPSPSTSTAAAGTIADPIPEVESARVPPRDITPLSDEQRLLDRALAGIATANPLSALAALTEHARRFPTTHAATRRKILAQACDLPAARETAPCSGAAAGSTAP